MNTRAPDTFSIQHTRDAAGELFIWTNIDPAHEDDFNRWYDREHMAERAAIPGFIWARRYRAHSGPRRYLALYRTDTVHTFLSAPYKKAFEHQTAWSVANFARMRDTTRRVTIVSPLTPPGTGSALTLIQLGDAARAERAVHAIAKVAGTMDGLLSARVLTPDASLSTPLPAPGANNVIEPYLVVDCNSQQVAAAVSRVLIDALDLAPEQACTFALLWELRSADLAPLMR